MAKILIVEDDEFMADMLGDCLSAMDHIVEKEKDGASGLERLRRSKYELVVLDWQLPRLSGIEICRQLKFELPHIPVMILTSMDRRQDKEAGFDAGADDYLAKPIKLQDFFARVRALLRRSTIVQD